MRHGIGVVGSVAVALVIVSASVCPPAQAYIDEITILPANPTVGSEVTVHVGGFLPDLCWTGMVYTTVQSDNIFTIEITATDSWEPGQTCAQALVPYSIDSELGILPAGTYAVRVVERGNSLRSPFVNEDHACFAVGGAAFTCNCTCYSDFGCSGATDITDVVRALNVAFRGYATSSPPQCPWGEMDVNCSTVTDIVDVISIVDVAFRGAPASTFCDPCSP
jgi:hypothetical protein